MLRPSTSRPTGPLRAVDDDPVVPGATRREAGRRAWPRAWTRHATLTAHLFSAPALLLTIVILFVPMVYALRLSFYQYSLARPNDVHFIGLANYVDVLTHGGLLFSVWITLVYTVASVALEFLLGLAFALLLNRELRLQGIVRTLMMLPLFLTPIVVGLIWMLIYTPNRGILSEVTFLLGLEPVAWLGLPLTALPAVILVDVWQTTPFMFLVFLAGLQSLPFHVYEAASIDGATGMQTLLRVTLPMLKPLILVAVMIRGMDAFRSFDTIYLLTGGGPGVLTQVISLTVYYMGFQTYNLGLASAASYVVLVLVLLCSLYFVRELRRAQIDA